MSSAGLVRRRSAAQLLLTLKVFAAHYRHAPLQAGAIIIGITLAVTLLTGVRAINENALQSYSKTAEQLSVQAQWFITPANGRKTLDESLYFELRNAGYSQSLAVVEGRLLGEDGQRWRVQGSDLIAALTARESSAVKGTGTQSSGSQAEVGSKGRSNREERPSLFNDEFPLAAMLAGEPVAFLGEHQTDRLKGRESLELGDVSIEIHFLDQRFNPDSRLLMDISLAQTILGEEGRLSYIALFTDEDEDELRSLLNGRAELTRAESGDSLTALTDSFHLNLTAMSLLAFIVGLFIAYNGIRYSLLKRQRLFSQLQQLGLRKAVLIVALSCELMTLVLTGSLAGFVLGLQLSHWLHPMVSVTLEQLYDASILPGIWHWTWLLQAFLLTLAASLIACFSLFVQIWRQPLARSTGQYNLQASSQKVYRLQLAASILLAAIAAVSMPLTEHYRTTMFILALVVVSIPLALPWSLDQLTRLLSRLTSKGLTGYQLAETRELVAPMSLAMMAMLLAVTANISMNTLVGSFESTLRQWLEVRLHADLYVRPAQSQISDVVDYLEKQEKVKSVYKQYYRDSHHDGMPVLLVTKDTETLRKTTIFKSSEPDVWEQFFAGDSVVISEPMAVRLEIRQGDTIQLKDVGNRSFRVGGVFFDYGNPYGEVLISPENWQQQGFTSIPTSLGVSYPGDPSALRGLLREEKGINDALMYDQKQIRERAIAIFTRTFSITRVLNTLTLLVSAIGLFSACYMLTEARMAPIASLYSLGVSRRQLTTMVTGQMLTIVLLTCLVALPAGALLGYLLISKITLQAFGWTINMSWDWWAYSEVVLLAVTASLLAVFLPLYQQTRRPLVSSLQSEVL